MLEEPFFTFCSKDPYFNFAILKLHTLNAIMCGELLIPCNDSKLQHISDLINSISSNMFVSLLPKDLAYIYLSL